jgi:catechol 2,3-dioxygenase-like lactoylglutathione lyase family enzyme
MKENKFMKLRTLDHVSFLVNDVERSRQFYHHVLGLTEVLRPNTSNFNNSGAWFESENFQIHLIGDIEGERVAQVNPGYRPDELARGHIAHAAFEVDDLEATIQHLHACDVEIVGGPRPRGDGVQQLYICDPDRYVIELFSRPLDK